MAMFTYYYEKWDIISSEPDPTCNCFWLAKKETTYAKMAVYNRWCPVHEQYEMVLEVDSIDGGLKVKLEEPKSEEITLGIILDKLEVGILKEILRVAEAQLASGEFHVH